MTYEAKKELYDFSIRNAEESIKKADEQQKVFDSMILKFSAGVFALSFSIINTFIPLSKAHHKILLLLSWIFFILVILTGLLSFMGAVKKHTYDYDYELKRYEQLSEDKEAPEYNQRFFKICNVLNVFTFILFIAGIVCLLSFVFTNL